MAVRQLEVFIAGRFDEHHDLRAALKDRIDLVDKPPVKAIDLNVNRADPEPPLTRCYKALASADIVVLLVGDEYGSGLPNHGGHSYTHLEYRRALEESKVILPFLVGAFHCQRQPHPDKNLRDWVVEIEEYQTAARLDPARGAELLASEIFEVLFERLWEVFADPDVPRADEDDESTRSVWQKSPIERKLVVSLPSDRLGHPLRSLAADHAKEADDALRLNLPQIAIHHLKRVANLVPLEFLPSYWLARLLIGTGRLVQCREGLEYALRCARVAAKGEDAQVREMAALIVAARASERLEQRQDALDYANAAHERMRFHWLAKIELGRQFAIDRKTGEAFKYAREAFWLRSDAIHQIQGDPAYRRMGEAFDDFRRDLRREVSSETGAIVSLEREIEDFANQLEARGSGTAAAKPDEDRESGHRSSLGGLVHSARLSAHNSLKLLQRCAAHLANDVSSFKSGAFRELTPITKDAIWKSVETQITHANTLVTRLAKETEDTALWRRSTIRAIVIAVVVVAPAPIGKEAWRATLAFIPLFVGVIWGACEIIHSLWPKRDSRNIRKLRRELRKTVAKTKASIEAKEKYLHRARSVRLNAHRFRELVNQFEMTAGKRGPYAPAVSRHSKDHSDNVVFRMDERELDEDVKIHRERELLPPDLRYFAGDDLAPLSRYWFASLARTGSSVAFSRTAAYFRKRGHDVARSPEVSSASDFINEQE